MKIEVCFVSRHASLRLLTVTYWEVPDTLMDDIERIEVTRASFGTISGPNDGIKMSSKVLGRNRAVKM